MSAMLDPDFDDDGDADRCVSVESIDWHGIAIEVRYEANYLGLADMAHLSITSLSPTMAPLPITETGYRSHFLDGADVDIEGGPVAFVRRWLDSEAQSSSWVEAVSAARQFSLF